MQLGGVDLPIAPQKDKGRVVCVSSLIFIFYAERDDTPPMLWLLLVDKGEPIFVVLVAWTNNDFNRVFSETENGLL